MLTEVQRDLWDAYCSAENRATRTEKLRALNAFLDELTSSPQRDWYPWARSVAESVVDRGDEFVIRMPLFERAIFPALINGYLESQPGCARWLAGLAHLLSQSKICSEQLADSERTELGLLWVAVRQDSADDASRRRLIRCIESRLCFSLHELPAGILYGMDGATPEQCQALESELDELCRLVEADGRLDDYLELIKKCRFHFQKYRDFVENPGQYRSYAEFLNSIGANRP